MKVSHGYRPYIIAKHRFQSKQTFLHEHCKFFFVELAGTTKIKNLDDNIGGLAVKLTEEELKEISDAVPIDEVSGQREMDALAKYSWKFADTPLKC